MTRRSKDWNEGLAKDLQNPEFAREFLTAAVEEGVPLQVALAKVVRATGVKEFSETVGMSSPNVLRAISPKHNPTQETLERLLKPFGLRIGLAHIKQRRRGRAA
jgi:DNA-binding phage protein